MNLNFPDEDQGSSFYPKGITKTRHAAVSLKTQMPIVVSFERPTPPVRSP